MPLYVIAYDLIGKSPQYQPLEDYLKKLPARRIEQSVWAINTAGPASSIFDALVRAVDSKGQPVLEASARLIVAQMIATDLKQKNLEADPTTLPKV